MRQIAPWQDFSGKPVQEGDRVLDASGDMGIVVLRPEQTQDDARWCVDYGNGVLRCLRTELNGEGRAVVLDETGMHF
jgi:hypothetical protein